jgi:hypothetical protein
MTYPSRKNLLAIISPTPYDNPLLLDLVTPAPHRFFLGVALSGVSLVGSGGAGAPYSYSIISGSLPSGLSLNGTTGAITGTPTAQGVVSFVAEVQDSASNVFPHSFTINVESGLTPVVFQPTTGEKSVPYRFAFIVRDLSGTTVPSGYTVSVGTLPSGLSLSTAGVVSGTPGSGAVGVTQVTINVSYLGMSLDIPCTFTIADSMSVNFAEQIDPPAGWGGGSGTWLPSIVRGVDYVANIVIAGGVPPYRIIVPAGQPLPSGITLRPQDLQIRGKTLDPASTTNAAMSISVTDAVGGGGSATRGYFIIDTTQGRVQPQRNGVDVSGGNGALFWGLTEGANVSITASNDGYTVAWTIALTTSPTFSGTSTWSGPVIYSGVISPTALASGATNNWSPTGLSTCNVIRATANASGSTLNGLVAQAGGTQILLINLPGGTLTIANEAVGSTAANRFTVGAASLALAPGQCCVLWYDGTSQRWRVVAHN